MPWRTLGAAAAACALLLAAAGFVTLTRTSISAATALASPAPRAALLADDTPAVLDGNTLRVAGHVVHLAGVTAPARGTPCARGADCAGEAALRLASLVQDRRVACVLTGTDATGHRLARCRAGETDIGRAVIESGWAIASAEDLRAAERDARAAHRGIWAE